MYKIPLTNSPNQTFSVTIPVNGENKTFEMFLAYNDEAKYWMLTVTNSLTQEIEFTNLPLLFSFDGFANLLAQLDYKDVGSIYVAPLQETDESMPDDKNIGKNYVMLWGDNE